MTFFKNHLISSVKGPRCCFKSLCVLDLASGSCNYYTLAQNSHLGGHACAPLHLQRGCAAKARPGLPAGIYGLALCPAAGSLVRSVLTTSAPQRHLWTINSDTQAEREATEPTHCQLVFQQCTCAKTSFSMRFRLAPRVLSRGRIFQWLSGGSTFFLWAFLSLILCLDLNTP